MTMLLVGAPVLIDAKLLRAFLKQAQVVAGLLARSLGVTAGSPASASLDQCHKWQTGARETADK